MSQSSGLGIQVELGPCRVVRDEKGKFTTYTLHFRIAEEVHTFTSRFAKLYKFHESLLKNEDFQRSFGYNPPDFPPKAWFTDFTKPKHYRKRANKILKYFKIITARPSVLRNEVFQKGIHLPQNLQKLISKIAKGLKAKKYVEKHHNPRTPSVSKTKSSKTKQPQSSTTQNNQKNIPIFVDKKEYSSQRNIQTLMNDEEQQQQQQQQQQKESSISLESALKNLEIKTDKMFIDIVENMECKDNEDAYDELHANAINDLHLFLIEDILPAHLLLDSNDRILAENENENEKEIVINEALFKMMGRDDLDAIDDIALDIRDAIISSCDISGN